MDRDNTLLLLLLSVVLTMGALDNGWGGHIDDSFVSGIWENVVRTEHINMLELRAVYCSLIRCKVLIQSDNTTVVAYLNREGALAHPPCVCEHSTFSNGVQHTTSV
jgi:hypothetical protein